MPIVNYVRIENFRSIRSLTLDGLDDYIPLVGLNSSGKSNVLRALNVFFNGLVDEDGRPLDLADDYSSYAPKGKKKAVSVTVGLDLTEIHVRGQEEFQADHGIHGVLFVKRSWSLSPDKTSNLESIEFGPSLDALTPAGLTELAAVQTHLRSIRYIYVPNHTRPADLIRSELAPLRPTLVARLRATKAYRDASMSDLLAELGRMGDRMFGDVATSLKRGLPNTTVSPDLPSDFADLIFTVGVRAISDANVGRSPEFEGSGAQAFMLLHILDLADRASRSKGFGWVQGSIWAMEEPESFLHAGLRAQFSSDLRDYADDPRRQVIITTHQDEFVRVARDAWVTSKSADGTSAVKLRARDALEASTKRAITTFRHPLFTYPDVPVVLVEGKFDDVYLRDALAAAELRPRWKLISPDEAFGDGSGGDALYQYLKYNAQVISSRPNPAPVIVLRDWEATDAQKYDNVLSVHLYSKCLVAPVGLCNPELDEEFVGIERYLPTDLIARVMPKSSLGRSTLAKDSPLTVKRRALSQNKQALADSISTVGDSGPFMRELAKWLDGQVRDILQEVPATDFS
jgi:hypothetical protein